MIVTSHMFFLGYDCGVYTCMFAYLLSQDLPLDISEEDATRFRKIMALCIVQSGNGKLD